MDLEISDKIIKVMYPEILEQIDYNVLCPGYDIFDPELSDAELSNRSNIY